MNASKNSLFIFQSALILAVSLCLLFISNLTWAEALPVPKDRVILTIEGNINQHNVSNTAQFDLKTLEKLPMQTIKTTTRWTNGEQIFQGPSVRNLMQMVQPGGSQIKATALDGYSTPWMTIAELENYGVILAIKKNGNYLRIRDKGPIWMMYPMHSYPGLKTDLSTQYKLIWHLRSLQIR